ncbi:hypothetical protein LSH36_777g02080 [Paralvinella palmiformis]|uniref:Exostosin GT47 domain-containing protein n=1 Tax=Paralvinella palmiformis TaxID=53620 RepID=A0AAD9J0W5_9ANNE|nr:hypothetical protein LSH36_777g02080 [Paralvinella palmiformis]
MQAKKRYLLTTVGLGCFILLGYWSLWSASSGRDDNNPYRLQPRSFHGEKDHASDQDVHISAQQRRKTARPSTKDPENDCRMETCFDFGRCRNGFKVYVYPTRSRISSKYEEILRAIRESPYITADPTEACILIPSVDTLDRDKLSKDSYVHHIKDQIETLKYWNNGQNHFVFNLYAGTWPEYVEDDYGFDPGRAMIAQASMSNAHYRPGFDVSFPLFHKEHAFKGGESGYLTSNNVPPIREYVLTFKGKRYLTGIGSETRNSLYHIHNDKDIILLTTCRHGKEWRSIMDERCEKDNEDYDKNFLCTVIILPESVNGISQLVYIIGARNKRSVQNSPNKVPACASQHQV